MKEQKQESNSDLSLLLGKNIVLGVTGGIAAYKAVELASRLKKAGASVHIIMTESATQFVTPLTFREISGNPVVTSMWSEVKNWNVEHIALATMADLFVIAPATANSIGKIANGIADDMLTTTVMATQAPVVIAPAMNSNMYLNPIVKKNISTLIQYGYFFIEPDSGMLACGVEGKGRLPDSAVIINGIISVLQKNQRFSGKKILITAGGTIEPIDPVRYIGNRSSGKMGYALANAAVRCGANVVLVAGPTCLPDPPGARVYKIETAQEMRDQVIAEFQDADIVIKAAAVADYHPQQVANQKIKKKQEPFTLVLEKNPDILFELGQLKRQDQLLVGFAAETQDLLAHAQEKLVKKNLDVIVANDVTVPGAGFNADTNIVKMLFRNGHIEELPQMDKNQLSEIILDKIYHLCQKMS